MKREAVCPVCGKRFLADRYTQRYCSARCRKNAHHQETGEDRAGPPGGKIIRRFACAHCGKPVTVTDPNDKRSKFCSGRCERLYWKHRRHPSDGPEDLQEETMEEPSDRTWKLYETIQEVLR